MHACCRQQSARHSLNVSNHWMSEAETAHGSLYSYVNAPLISNPLSLYNSPIKQPSFDLLRTTHIGRGTASAESSAQRRVSLTLEVSYHFLALLRGTFRPGMTSSQQGNMLLNQSADRIAVDDNSLEARS